MELGVFKEKSKENLKIAELAFQEKCFNAAVSCAYYSMMQSAIAVLIEHGFLSLQKKVSHEWVQANFASKIISQKKLMASKFRSYLHTVHEIRIKADYSQQHISNNLAKNILKKADEFVINVLKEDL